MAVDMFKACACLYTRKQIKNIAHTEAKEYARGQETRPTSAGADFFASVAILFGELDPCAKIFAEVSALSLAT